jgi:hypothetical protein
MKIGRRPALWQQFIRKFFAARGTEELTKRSVAFLLPISNFVSAHEDLVFVIGANLITPDDISVFSVPQSIQH